MFVKNSVLRSLIKRRIIEEGLDDNKKEKALQLVDLIIELHHADKFDEDFVKSAIDNKIGKVLYEMAHSPSGMNRVTLKQNNQIKQLLILNANNLYLNILQLLAESEADIEEYSEIINDEKIVKIFVYEIVKMLVGVISELPSEFAFEALYQTHDEDVFVHDGSGKLITDYEELIDLRERGELITIISLDDDQKALYEMLIYRISCWFYNFDFKECASIKAKIA